jgi:hypothetical protein
MSVLKLIKESIDAKFVLVEEASGEKNYFIEGPFLQSEIKNRNGRIYPLSVMQKEVGRYTEELIKKGRALGELGHPDSPTINLPLVSHKITELTQDGNDFNGKAKILDTPNGKIVKSLLGEGVTLGVSSRGLGSIHTTKAGNMVGEDFMLATAADIVSDPSAPDAFVRGIMENREWVWDNGVLKEREVAAIKEQIVAAPKKKSVDRALVMEAAFERFLQEVRIKLLMPKSPKR